VSQERCKVPDIDKAHFLFESENKIEPIVPEGLIIACLMSADHVLALADEWQGTSGAWMYQSHLIA
jgi:hypothetical protein